MNVNSGFLLVVLFPIALVAKEYTPKTAPQDSFAESTENLVMTENEPLGTQAEKTSAIHIDEKELLASPQLLQRAMYSVVISKQIEGIRVVLPIYKKLSNTDPVLIQYAAALWAHHDRKLSTAINMYRELLSTHPHMTQVRLDFAMALYANNQIDAALDQLTKLKSEELPESVVDIIESTVDSISRQEEWQVSSNFYYLSEDNINNAPDKKTMKFGNGILTFPDKEKAHGVHVSLGAKKRINIGDHFYGNIQLNANTNYYWDNEKYNDLSIRIGSGLGYRSARFTAEVQPFVKKRFYSGQPFSFSKGAFANFSYQVNRIIKVSNTYEWAYEKYNSRVFLDGKRFFVGASALYIANSRQYWFAGVGHSVSEAKTKEDQFKRNNVYVGWGQEWPKGISSKVVLAVADKKYEGVDFFNIMRVDKEYSANVSLWHRNVHFWGITPRVVGSWRTVESNHFMYDKKPEAKLRIEFSKFF